MEVDMFVDVCRITVQAGDGGNGAVAWRREKYVPAGGPAGGDGGRGGSVILEASSGLRTLMDFRYKRVYKAQPGENGRSKKQFGADADDIVLKVPVGTVVRDAASEKIIVDLKEDGERYVIAQGGGGGKGNARFTTSTRQAPTFSQMGYKGQKRDIILELKLLADVGLVGFPNVGKSTLLSVISSARPKIANYQFTTLSPNLGVVSLGPEQSFVVADIPGLIEGASEGVGLGHDFLRHVERTSVLIHVLDGSGDFYRDPVEDFDTINRELLDYNEALGEKPQVVFINKMDLPEAIERETEIRKALEERGYTVFSGSAAAAKDIQPMLYKVYDLLDDVEINYDILDEDYYVETPDDAPAISVRKENGRFIVDGTYIERLLGSTFFDDHESLRYFQENLRKNGVIDRLRELGIEEGQSVFIDDYEFEFFE